jgi:hypothetical protein
MKSMIAKSDEMPNVCGHRFVIKENPIKLNVVSQQHKMFKAVMVSFGILLIFIRISILYNAYGEMQRFDKSSLDAGYTTASVICSAFGAILVFMPFCRKK